MSGWPLESVPQHVWDDEAKLWLCLGCGWTHPEPCRCPCCEESFR